MAWEAWLTLATVILMFTALARNWAPADVVLWICLTSLVVAGTCSGSERLPDATRAVAGFGNTGLVTVAFLFVVVEGLSRTGASAWVSVPLTQLSKTRFGVRPWLLVSVASASAFLNNTAIVALFMPITQDLCKRTGLSPSKIFLPMCYAATLGGVCTLMGTSTNLVVDGLLRKNGLDGLGVFELAWVGIPLACIGTIYLLIASRYLLPDRKPPVNLDDDPREYSVEMMVDATGPLVGKSIEAAGLRRLPGLYLAEIQRGSEIIAAVGPQERLQANDQLVFVGVTDSVVDLRRIAGLLPATDANYEFQAGHGRLLTEVVVSNSCPLVGKKIRESDFRSVYDSVVIALARNGKRITGKIGEVQLRSGDCLLLETQADFAVKHRLNRHFFLVSSLPNSEKQRSEKSFMSLAILVVLVGLVGLDVLSLLLAAMLGACAMLVLRCCTATQARQSVEWSVLLVIGAALGMADALQSSGAADAVAAGIMSMAGNNSWALLAAVYLTTLLATEMITNNAAAALMFPIALKASQAANIHAEPLIIAVMIAASCGFATPFGYQTNLMVAGPGGYQFKDYFRFGAPLDLLMMLVAVVLIPRIWPF